MSYLYDEKINCTADDWLQAGATPDEFMTQHKPNCPEQGKIATCN
jgi:hypothetical protein